MPPRGAPGASSRGRGGKFKKFTRGGGKHFSRDLRPLDADGNEVSMWSEGAQKKKGGNADDDDDDDDSDDDSEEDSEEDSDEDSDDDSDAAGPSQAQQELTREERRAAKKAQKDAAIARRQKGQVQVGDLPSDSEEEEEEEDDMPANPNHSKAARQQTKVAPPGVEAATEAVSKMSVSKSTSTMSRREREALEKQQAAERYRKLHAEGKTDEAKADMARLQQIREKREADAARKQAEKEEKDELEKERRLERETKEAKKREAALGKPVKKGKK